MRTINYYLTLLTRFFVTEVTLAAGSYVSFAGITEILYYKSSEDRVYSLDGGWNIPADLNADQIPPYHTTKPNGASVLVPGFFAGMLSHKLVYS